MNHVSDSVKARAYDSSLRAERARENRAAILRAAHELFVTRGYASTSVAAIAREAGVSPDLIYKVFTNKRRLLMEVLNFVVLQDPEARSLQEQEGPQAVKAETDQRRQLAMLAADITASSIRSRPVDDVFRSAAATDPDIAERHARVHQTRLKNLRAAVGWVAANGPLRAGVSVEDAAATLWLVTGPDSHRQMVDGLDWEVERWRAWVHSTIEAAILPPAETVGP
jgi:AcrR family transcriptional regulator